MALERTLAIIKPDGIEKRVAGKILDRIYDAGLTPVAMRLHHLSRREAEGFYAVHKARPFFASLVEFMTRSPVLLMTLEGEEAISKWRGLMGATDPAKADAGTIRKDFASNIEENTVHGSDAPETAAFETHWFFRGSE